MYTVYIRTLILRLDDGQVMQNLPNVLIGSGDDLVQGLFTHVDLLLELDAHHCGPDLLHSGPVEPQIEAVVGQTPDLLTLPVVAHANHRNFGALQQLNELGHSASVLISGHSVDFVHQQDPVVA